MNLQHGDIFKRSEQGGTTLWVSQRLLTEVCGVSETYLWKRRSIYKNELPPSQQRFEILPDNGKSWRWARMNGAFYYDLKRIPNRAPKFYRDCLPGENELLGLIHDMKASTKSGVVEQIKKDIVSRVGDFFDNNDVHHFRFLSEPTFTPEKAQELAEAKAWCKMVTTFISDGRFKQIGVRRKEDFYQYCIDILSVRKLEGLKVTTARSLRKKLHYFPPLGDKRQCEFLINGRYGNQNARIVGKFKLVDTVTGEELAFDIHEALMFNLYMNPGNPQKEDLLPLWEEYKEALQDFTTDDAMAYRTFCQYCSRFDKQLQTAKARHGEEYYNKHYLGYVPSQHLQYAHSLFAGDGSATVAYKYYDAEGTCRRMNLYVILISDVASRYIAGWAAAREGFHNETPAMVEKAVKMAVMEGGKNTMFEIVTDNHKAFTGAESKDVLNSIFSKVRTIRPHNSQANPAETQFRLFKKTLKRFNNFLRTSWAAGIGNQANPDFIPNNELLPTYEEALRQLQKIIEQYNNKKLRDGSTPAQRFENKHPDCVPMDARQLRSVFGNKTAVEIGRMRGFVDVWKGDSLSKFEIPDYNNGAAEKIAQATGYKPDAKVRVIWNNEAADLYSLDGKYLMTCKPAPLSSQSQAESNEQTSYALGHHEKRKRLQTEAADNFENDAVRAMDLAAAGIAEPYNVAVTDNNFSKEDYNANMEAVFVDKSEARKRIERDFNDDDWS